MPETSLITLIEFYKIIKDDLSQIESLAGQLDQFQLFVNPEFFTINEQSEKLFREYIQTEMSSQQLKTNYYQKLFGPQI